MSATMGQFLAAIAHRESGSYGKYLTTTFAEGWL